MVRLSLNFTDGVLPCPRRLTRIHVYDRKRAVIASTLAQLALNLETANLYSSTERFSPQGTDFLESRNRCILFTETVKRRPKKGRRCREGNGVNESMRRRRED